MLDTQRLAEIDQIRRRTHLEFREVHDFFALLELLGRNHLKASFIIRILILRRTPAAAAPIGIALALVAGLFWPAFR